MFDQRALYFPDIQGTSLAGGEGKVHTTNILDGKVSVVTLLTTRISEVRIYVVVLIDAGSEDLLAYRFNQRSS